MSEQVLAQVPSIFRWKGPKQGRTMFSAQPGRLTLTTHRLLFEPARGEPLVVPLGAVEGAELTGKRIKNLTVAYRGTEGTEHSTFATQQFGMPQGQQWVDQLQLLSAAARGEAPPLPPIPAAGPTSPAGTPWTGAPHSATAEPPDEPAHPAPAPPAPRPMTARAMGNAAFDEFQRDHAPAPLLESWRVVKVLPPEVVDPATGRVEVWGDVVARGPIQYLHAAVGYGPDGSVRVIAGAEVMPGFHDDCYLGVFMNGMHTNLGAHEECRTLDGFLERGVDVVLGVLDGARHASGTGSAVAPAQIAAEQPAPPPREHVDTTTGPVPAVPPPHIEEDVVVPRTQEEAIQVLRRLNDTVRADPPQTPVAIATFLQQTAAACAAMGRDADAATLRDAARFPQDARWLTAAGSSMLDASLAPLAVVPLEAALREGSRDAGTVELLAIALDLSDDLHGAAEVLRTHAWAREESEGVTALWSHLAAMTGDLAEARQAAARLRAGGEYESYRALAQARLARAEALGPLEGDPDHPEAALRWWDAVLQGTVLLHTSAFGVEDMGGRYAAVFDQEERLAEILAALDAVLVEAGVGRPGRVLAAPDRDSEILGWVLTTRYGLDAPARLDDPGALADDAPGTTLVASYTWTGVLDEAAGHRFRDDPTSVLFAYSLEWTRMHRLVPDVVGMEVQTIVPPWGERMRVNGMPGVDLPEGARPEVTRIPRDERDAAVVGREVAGTLAAHARQEHVETARAAADIVSRLRDAGAPAGLVGGTRTLWYPGGPFRSNRF